MFAVRDPTILLDIRMPGMGGLGPRITWRGYPSHPP
jgi:CheY-like chemotaxis protein